MSKNKLSKSLSLSLPSLKSDFSFSESDYDSEDITRQSILGGISRNIAPRLLSITDELPKSFSKNEKNKTESIRHKLFKDSFQNVYDSDMSELYDEYGLEDYDDAQSKLKSKSKNKSKIGYDSELESELENELESESKSKSKTKVKSKLKTKSKLKKRVSKKKLDATQLLESDAKKQADIYYNNLKKKLADKDKNESYKLLEKELENIKDDESLLTIAKKSRLNYLLEEIHAKFYEDDNKVKFNYPVLYDKDFNKKIYQKYEFYKNKIKERTPATVLEDLEYNNDFFRLSNTQKFLKNYISPSTPYRGLLIFHGVGVGKTCAAISIAEQFKDELLEEGKKIYVIRGDEIKKQIFKIGAVRVGKGDVQCTGDTYIKLVNEPKIVEKCEAGELDWCATLENLVKKTTKKYYEFNGALQWANRVMGEVKKATKNVPPQYKKEREIERYRKLFSDSIIIVDEAHNIKDKSEKDQHIVPPILTKVATYAKNLRLILLSATPMFDSYTDLIPILNYLLLNDGRPKIKERDIFTKEGDFVAGGKEKLIESTRGYVSYLRGEDPLTFPLRFSSAINETNNIIKPEEWPKVDIYGNKLTKSIQYMDIIKCPMSPHHYKVYKTYVEKRHKQNLMEKTSAAWSAEMQISNFVFQELSKITNDPKECYGERGFLNVMEKVEGKTQYRFKEQEYAEIFTMPTMKKYSSKFYEIIKSIESADGLVFVYSQYETSGILPLAFALEIAGYTKYKSKHMPLLEYKGKKPDNGKQYLIISGKDSLKKGDEEFINKGPNMIYEPVKVILGTKAASEGLNLFGVREMHVVDPWHNLNRLEQVVGRGTRNLSHKRLEPEKQNLTIYYYAATTPNNDEESVDMKIYRTAEEKDLKVTKIELLLKRNAIDCNLNKEGNFYPAKIWNEYVDVITSRGQKRKVKIHDKPYSRICHYQKNCEFKCIPDLKPLKENEVDKSTYSLKFFEDDIKEIMYLITRMYQHDIVYTLDDIIDYVRNHKEYLDINALYKALDNLVKAKINFKDKLGRSGRIVYQGNYYLFQPSALDYDKTIYEHRRLPLTIKTNVVDLGSYVQQLRKDRVDLMKKDQYDYSEILDKIESNVLYIMTNDIQAKFRTSIKLAEEESFAIVLDRLVYQYKNVLLKNLVKKMILKQKLSTLEVNIINHINANLIRFGEVLDIKNDDIYGYKLIHNDKQVFYVYNIEAGEFEQDQGNRNKILEKQKEYVNLPKESDIMGYLKFDKNDTPPSFKIRDIQNLDNVKNIKGTSCFHKGKNEIYNYIKTLSNNDSSIEKTHKTTMCNDIEVLLRRLNNKDKGKKLWFFNAEEYAVTHHDAEN